MGTIAFLFPGQGAQYPGMGKELYDAHPVVRDIFDRADALLGEPLSKLCFEGPEGDLMRTEHAQPCILTFSTAVSELLKSKGILPAAAAGLSLGEYSALVCADALTFEDALPLVRKRGMFMQEAVPAGEGTMAAIIGLDARQLTACLERAADAGTVTIANYNCPGQLVISGTAQAVEKACALAREAGAKRTLPLAVSGPFHSPLLSGAGLRLQEALEAVSADTPAITVISNVAARPIESGTEVKNLLVAQVSHSVRWEDSVRFLLQAGVQTFVEAGPGKVLSGFVKKIDKEAKVLNVEDAASLDSTLKELEGAG